MSHFPIYFQLHVYNLELWIQVLLQHISTSFVIWCLPLNLDNLLLKTSLLNLKFNGPRPKIIYISNAVNALIKLNLMFTVFRVEYIFFLWHFHCFIDSKHIEYQQFYQSSLCNSFGADTVGLWVEIKQYEIAVQLVHPQTFVWRMPVMCARYIQCPTQLTSYKFLKLCLEKGRKAEGSGGNGRGGRHLGSGTVQLWVRY